MSSAFYIQEEPLLQYLGVGLTAWTYIPILSRSLRLKAAPKHLAAKGHTRALRKLLVGSLHYRSMYQCSIDLGPNIYHTGTLTLLNAEAYANTRQVHGPFGVDLKYANSTFAQPPSARPWPLNPKAQNPG